MRVLLLAFVIPTAGAHSGATIVLERQCHYLKRNHKLTLLTFPPATKAEHEALRSLREDGVDVITVGGTFPPAIVALKRRAQDVLGHLSGRKHGDRFPPPSAAMQSMIDKTIASGDYDLFHVEYFGLGGYRWPRTIPSVVIEHEVLESNDPRTERIATQHAAWRQADVVQVFTEADAERVREAVPSVGNGIRVNPFGVELRQRCPAEDTVDGSILFVGNFEHPPNEDAARWLVEDIMPAVRKKCENAQLTFVGGSPPPWLTNLKDGDIEVTGRVDSVLPYMQRARVVVAPLRTGGGMRVKVLEAMAHGKAIVSTSLGAAGLFNADELQAIEIADDSDAFADRVATLLSSPDRCAALGNAAYAQIQDRFGWEAYAQRLSSIYRDAIEIHRVKNDPGIRN